MIDRRAFLSLVGGSILAKPLAGGAQSTAKVYRIGYLTIPSREAAQGGADTFKHALRDLGWIDGQNVLIEYRFADSRIDRLPDLAAGLVQLRADVIVAGATAAVAAAKAVTQTIPIVMFLPADPVRSGLVASLARPGGNVTGLTTTAGPEIYGKQLQLLKDAFPRITRVAVLFSHAAPAYALVVREIETAIRALGLQWRVIQIRNPEDLDDAFTAMTKDHVNAIFIPADSMFYQYRTRLVRLAAKTRLPAMWGLREQAEAGGLLAYSSDLNDLARRAATYVDKILKGAKPADLPVEQPTKFELVVNLKTAKTLGLTIPQSVLLRADQVID